MESELEQIIKIRRSTRSFTGEAPDREAIEKILESAVYAPYGGATGIPLNQIRKIYLFRQDTQSMERVRELMLGQIRKNAKRFGTILTLLPFLKKKFGAFAAKLDGFSKKGIAALNEAPCFIVIAEKKGFPPVEKQSMAHTLENMWLTATSLGLGFQLISATGTMAGNKDFMTLLGLSKGEYQVEGCAVGYPKNPAGRKRELDINDFVTWMK
ncbi:nitroreductase family protein [uncultured Alistipes sp.]|jgi:hypothetical protein|uniref:nitroreductase family protein n=1 Tax=uncultured Alistipes sp. TaxID=538949 RepID=UPI0025DB69FA|nr:nitroreductase family protein [uncultured Alistipes sp.]